MWEADIFLPQQNILKLGFVKLLTYFSVAIHLIFLKRKSSNFISTLYIFAYKSMHLLAILKMDEQVIVEGWGGACFVRCSVERHAMLCRKSPRSLLHGKTILSDDLNVISVCRSRWSGLMSTAPSHCVTLKSPSSMLPDDTPCMPCSTPHDNIMRETAG